MRSAAEEFAIQLGRASKKALRYLRWVRPQDRDDVTATAMLCAWEARDSYDPTTQGLEQWFAEHLKTAANASRRDGRRRDRNVSIDSLQNLAAVDDTERALEVREAAQKTAAELTADERIVAGMLASGMSIREVRESASSIVTRRMFVKLRKLRELLPDCVITRGAVARRLPESDTTRRYDKPAPIDHEIERMLRRPATERADCPVCFRCCWFDGLLPKNYHGPSHIQEADVRDAVWNTELRKMEIAKEVRS